MPAPSRHPEHETIDVTFSLIRQGSYRFYSLTLLSDVLADTCFVSTRDEDNEMGFQRLLDKKRAQDIARYIDSGSGSIPNAVILSAQSDAEFEIKRGGRALKFKRHPKAFLILDGQHRVWGYRLAESELKVPVIIYQGLTRTQETRLFIDINTKQKPVPNELLLDIKYLAEIETNSENILRELFNNFNSNSNSSLFGLLSPHGKGKNKISRTTFNSAFQSISDSISNRDVVELYEIFNAYFSSIYMLLKKIGADESLINPIIFRSLVAFFPEVASRVKDRFEGEYTKTNFREVLEPAFNKVSKIKFLKPGRSYKDIHEQLSNSLIKSFSL
ncbi:MAG: DGQHR domain-containing protein [Vampirovibrionales bacterium]|nr:DGQHR domain-containing protein [Vampirovibrionales bacterium]